MPLTGPVFRLHNLKGAVFLWLFLSQVFSSYAQKEFYSGFVVRESGDTLQGRLRYPETNFSPEKIFFRNEKDTISFNVNDLKEFMLVRADDDTVIYKKSVVTYGNARIRLYQLANPDSSLLVRDTVFLQLVMLGDLKLYSLKVFSYRWHYFIQSGDSSMEELVYRKYYQPREFSPALNARTYIPVTGNDDDPVAVVIGYKFLLLQKMKNCSGTKKMIYKMRYNEMDLRDVFIKYNTCFGENRVSYIRKPERTKFCFTVFGGYNSVWVNYPALDENVKSKLIRGNGYTAGLGFNMRLSRDMPKLWLHNELAINAFKISSTAPRYYSNFSFHSRSIAINLLYLKARVLPAYYFGRSHSKVVPYINAGFSFGYLLKVIENRTYLESQPNTNNPAVAGIKRYDLGCAASFGVRFFNYATIEVKYEFGDGFSYNDTQGAETHSLMITGRVNFGAKAPKS